MSAQHTSTPLHYNEFPVTCRVCREYVVPSKAVRYGRSHYAHAECGMRKWRAKFFDKLDLHQLRQLPAMVAKRHDLLGELERVIETRGRAALAKAGAA